MLIRKDEKGKWYPIPISDLDAHISQLIQPHAHLPGSQRTALIKNISYSLQHFEFLNRVHEDLKVSEVIWKQNIKTAVIVGASIIEALFFYLLIANGKPNWTEWKSSSKTESSEFKDGDQVRKIVSELFTKLPKPVLEEMSFDAMCKKVEKRGLAKLTSDEFYQHLPHLRKLRNRVHIHTGTHGADTDYFAFSLKDFNLMKRVLHLLLTSDLFPQKNENYWTFLSVTEVKNGA